MATKSIEEIRAEMAARKSARQPPVSENGASESPPTENRRQIVPRRTRSIVEPEERQLPHDGQAEQGVLGSMLHDPTMVIPSVVRYLDAGAFYIPAHRTIFASLLDHFRETPKLDMSTFTLYLDGIGKLESVGGPVYITKLHTETPSAAAWEYYTQIVREKYVRREMIAAATESRQRAFTDGDEDIREFVQEIQQKFERVRLLASGRFDAVEDFSFEQLLAFDPKADRDVLIGQRWLCRGFTCLWAGAAGAGKSALEMQLAIYWGCGIAAFGIKPVRPLRSLVIQAENDLGDTGEQLQGVLEGVRKADGDAFDSKSRQTLIETNVLIKRVIGTTGDKFISLLDSLVEEHRPDLVWIDPLFAFAGCDLIDAKEAGRFMREGLIPIAVKRRCCIHVIHHVGKPDRDSKAKSSWTDIDFQYLGFGSSEIQNAFRAVNIMLPVSGEEKVFRLILSKRGARAGAKTPDGEFTTSVYLTHAKEGICWLQVEKPDEESTSKGPGPSFKPDAILAEMSPVNGMKTGDLCKHVLTETGMSRATFYRLLDELKKARKIRIEEDGWVISPTKTGGLVS